MYRLRGQGYPCEHGHWAIDGVEYIVTALSSWYSRGVWRKDEQRWSAQAWPLRGDVSSFRTGLYPNKTDALMELERMVAQRHNVYEEVEDGKVRD